MSIPIPTTMKAMVLMKHGGMDALEWHEDWQVPIPAANEVLIKVKACGLNNTDVNTRVGWYSKTVTKETSSEGYADVQAEDGWSGVPFQFPRIQGADVCGTVVQVGADADATLMGKRVIVDCWLRDWDDPLNRNKCGYYGSEKDGGFSEYTVVDYRNVAAIENKKYSDAELATFSCSWSTAEGQLSRANVQKGDRVLVTGASGGVGSAIIQLSKVRGATVIALTSESKHDQVKKAGADFVLARAPTNLKAALLEATGFDKVTVVCDPVGGDYFKTLIEALDRGGRYTSSGAIAGPIVELDLRTFYLNDLTFYGSTVVLPHVFRDLVKYIENEEVTPMLAKTFELKDLKLAQEAFIAKKHIGNIAVVTSSPAD